LNRLGKALHLSKDGNLVVKAQRTPAIGAMTYDAKLRPIGVVSDIIGPKNAPYILVKTKLEDASKLQGQVLYGEP
jgi:RNA-binding protein